MDVLEAINKRKSYRGLSKEPISRETIEEIVKAGRMAPSCSNNQPWRYIVVDQKEDLERLYPALTDGNYWMKLGPVIVAIITQKDYDCVIKSRVYHHFDTGLATGFMLLRAQELGIQTHLVAGYSPSKTRKILGIPDEMDVVSLMAMGRLGEEVPKELSEKHRSSEGKRPERLKLHEILHYNGYNPEVEPNNREPS